MNNYDAIRHKMYGTIFKEADRIGTYSLIKSLQQKDATEKKGIAEKLSWGTLAIYHLLQRKNIPLKEDLISVADMKKAFFAVRLATWKLLKANSCVKKFAPLFNGVIFNAKIIESQLKVLSKACEQLQPSPKKRFLTLARIAVFILLLMNIPLFIYMVAQNASAIANTRNQLIDYGLTENSRVIAQWSIAPKHNFENAVRRSTGLTIFQSSSTTIMAYYMSFFPVLMILLFSWIIAPVSPSYDHNDEMQMKECVAEFPTYKRLLEELSKKRKPLDDRSKQLLQEKGLSPQELDDYHIYDSSAFGDLTALFKKVKEYSLKRGFHAVTQPELNRIYSIYPEPSTESPMVEP